MSPAAPYKRTVMWNEATRDSIYAEREPRWPQRKRYSFRSLFWLLVALSVPTSVAGESPRAPTLPTAGAREESTEVADAAVGRELRLEDAYRLALANEEQIKIAGKELAKSQLLPWRAYAQLTPRAEIDGVYTRNKEEIAFISQPTLPGQTGTPSTIRPGESWQGTFVVTQPLIQPAFPPTLLLGKAAVRQSVETYDFTIREVLFGVARAYYDVLRSQAQVVVAQDTLRLTQDELKQAQARFRVGEVTKTDVLRAEVEVARAERAVITNQNGRQLAVTVLARAIGVTGAVRVVEPPPQHYGGGGYEQLV